MNIQLTWSGIKEIKALSRIANLLLFPVQRKLLERFYGKLLIIIENDVHQKIGF